VDGLSKRYDPKPYILVKWHSYAKCVATLHVVYIWSGNQVFYINVREYRKDNQIWTIQINWQHRVYKTKTNKTKTQHIMCWNTTIRKQTIVCIYFQQIQTIHYKNYTL
jgi:hypothetical protein